jgi:hypothetical protein
MQNLLDPRDVNNPGSRQKSVCKERGEDGQSNRSKETDGTTHKKGTNEEGRNSFVTGELSLRSETRQAFHS